MARDTYNASIICAHLRCAAARDCITPLRTYTGITSPAPHFWRRTPGSFGLGACTRQGGRRHIGVVARGGSSSGAARSDSVRCSMTAPHTSQRDATAHQRRISELLQGNKRRPGVTTDGYSAEQRPWARIALPIRGLPSLLACPLLTFSPARGFALVCHLLRRGGRGSSIIYRISAFCLCLPRMRTLPACRGLRRHCAPRACGACPAWHSGTPAPPAPRRLPRTFAPRTAYAIPLTAITPHTTRRTATCRRRILDASAHLR